MQESGISGGKGWQQPPGQVRVAYPHPTQPKVPSMTAAPAPAAETDSPDRYVSFRGIDFEANMAAVMAHLCRYIDDPATSNALWDRFKQRLAVAESSDTPTTDKLLLLHSHVYYMVELFEDHEDEAALEALKKLEEECF